MSEKSNCFICGNEHDASELVLCCGKNCFSDICDNCLEFCTECGLPFCNNCIEFCTECGLPLCNNCITNNLCENCIEIKYKHNWNSSKE